MHAKINVLLARTPIVTDGAWGTQLQARGLSSGECPDAWNLTHPSQVEAVARSYVEAGSQIILTNTFGANRLSLDKHGLADQAVAINQAGVVISRRAAAGSALVFASIGPSGKVLMMGDVTEAALTDAFTEQARALADAGADALVVETMSDLAEARLAIQAAKATGLPVVASLVFDSGKDKDRTMMGITPEKAATELEVAGADVVGANCGQGIAGYIKVCQRMRSSTSLPIWIKANAGLPVLVEGRITYQIAPSQFAAHVPDLAQAGASFIGGCCGTSPEFIREICSVVKRLQNPAGQT
ncbi:MAG TPA: homocysteine S-methyltransferase family protein [Candidatus Paceibacterota bacterium]|nr:homocysteine S-methyltransferase family protein [Candidatus Paceibacterota bacterium]